MTLTQLEAALGDPLVAFSRIPSTHHDILAALTWDDMLCIKQIGEDVLELTQIEDIYHVGVGCAPYVDLNWWESASILN